MGINQSTILDFREIIIELKYAPEMFAPTRHDKWKILFLTPMEPNDIAAMISFEDVRFLRRHRPDRLALLLFKCVEQLSSFVCHHPKVSDYCCIMNSVRILCNAMPYCIEDHNVDGTDIPADEVIINKATRMLRADAAKLSSVFSEFFLEHFWFKNLSCDSVKKENKISSAGDVPLAHQLVQMLVKLLLVPNFTLSSRQARNAITASVADLVSGVFPHLLWATGAFSTETFGMHFTTGMNQCRIDVMRLLTIVLSEPMFRGSLSKFENRPLAVLCSEEECPLTPTIAASWINIILQYQPNGVLPYTSYVGAALPEQVVGMCLQLLNLVLYDGTTSKTIINAQVSNINTQKKKVEEKSALHIGSSSEPVEGAESQKERKNVFRKMFVLLFLDEPNAKKFVESLIRLIHNPLSATQTWISGSQKNIMCHHEALLLLLNLLNNFPESMEHVLLRCSNFVPFFYAMLFFIQQGATEQNFFSEVQLSLFVLLKLLSCTEFSSGFLNKIVDGHHPLRDIPPKSSTTTYADHLCLMMCSLMSVASPRWYYHLLPAAATILVNLPIFVTSLSEVTCFELFHCLEFATQRGFLIKGLVAQATASLVVESVVMWVLHKRANVIPLVAMLGTSNCAAKLDDLIKNPNPSEVADKFNIQGHSSSAGVLATEQQQKDGGALEEMKALTSEDNKKTQQKKSPEVDKSRKNNTTTQLVFCEEFLQQVQVQKLVAITLEAQRQVDEEAAKISSSVTSQHQHVNIEEQLPKLYPKLLHRCSDGLSLPVSGLQLRAFVRSNESETYCYSVLWQVIHQHNISPPLFDAKTAKLLPRKLRECMSKPPR